MHSIKGHWHDGKTSRQTKAEMRVDMITSTLTVEDSNGNELASGDIRQWRITDRLGHTTRMLYLVKDGAFATHDQEAVDELQRKLQPSWLTSVVHRLESRLGYIMLALLATLAVTGSAVVWGVPALATVLAERIPRAAVVQLTSETLAVADRAWFNESTLSTSERQRLENHFAPIMDDHDHLTLNLLFRGGGPLGPNAVALPDGTMIMTDELVGLASHDDELAVILLHEIGHIEHNHGLRSLIQNSILGIAFVMLTGDAAATAEVLLGAPLIINELAYSRRFEYEADDYARDYMLENDMALAHFHNIMWRLTHGESFPGMDALQEDGTTRSGPWARYLSTHPPTPERIERFQE